MKIKISLILIIILALNSCKTKENKSKNFLLPDKVKATYIVNINDEPKTEWINNVKKSNLLLSMVKKAINGKTVFNYEDCKDTICKDDILANMGKQTQNILYIDTLGNEIDTIINTDADYNSLTGFYFVENWSFNIQNMQFSKKIITYAPYRSYFKNNKDSTKTKRTIFFVKQNVNNDNNNFSKIAENVKSAFIYNAPEPNSISGLDINKLNNFIIKYSLNPQNSVYNFNNTTEKLIIDDFKEHLGIETTYVISDNLSDTIKYTSDADPNRITGVVFIEDWLFDENNLNLKKQVKAIAPICEYYTYFENGQEIKRRVIPFIIKLKY